MNFTAKKLYSTLFVLLFVSLAFGQDHGLFWKIEKKGYKDSYLYGTMHLKDKRLFSFEQKVIDAIQSSKFLYTELDMKNIDQVALAQDMTLPQDTSLEDLYEDSTDYQTVSSFLDEHFGHYGSLLYRFKPFYIEFFFADQFTNSDSPMALDEYLVALATEAKVKTGGLETLEEQMSAVNSIPLETQAQDLLLIVESYSESGIQNENDESINAYLQQDLKALDNIINDYTSDTPEFTEKFLVDRNKRMVKRLMPKMKKGKVFCAVGAVHLSGEYGMINLLRAQGFTVSQIPFTFETKEE